jgi:flagellar motor switch protein FliN
MPEDGKDLDSLLAEVSDLANQAASALGSDADPAVAPAQAELAQAEPAPMGPGEADAAPSDLLTMGAAAEPPPPAPEPAPPRKRVEDPRRILRLQVPVIVELARRTMPMADILNLSSGSIIEFEKLADGELDLMINNKCVGRGMAVKVGENFGLRVRSVGSLQDRIRALGK